MPPPEESFKRLMSPVYFIHCCCNLGENMSITFLDIVFRRLISVFFSTTFYSVTLNLDLLTAKSEEASIPVSYCINAISLTKISAVRIIEISNRIVTSGFDSKRAQLFAIFEYLPSPISYLFNRMTPIFHLSNHA